MLMLIKTPSGNDYKNFFCYYFKTYSYLDKLRYFLLISDFLLLVIDKKIFIKNNFF